MLQEGDRVEFPPHMDIWMRGARYGVVTHVFRDGNVSVLPERGGAVQRVNPDLLTLIRKHDDK